MPPFDYPSGLVSWDKVQNLERMPYTVIDPQGREVKVTVKYKESHSYDGWDPIMADPAYHYNLGSIIKFARPEEILESRARVATAKEDEKQGEVLIYKKDDYIIGLDSPSAATYESTTTEVVVCYTDDGNYTKTNLLHKRME